MQTQVVILAAGIGKRMGSELPKVLLPVGGVPMITRLLRAVKQSGVTKAPVVVIGHGAEKVCDELGKKAQCVMQHEQLGTGHAVRMAKDALAGAGQVVVLYGDHPLVSESVIKDVVSLRKKSNTPIAIMTTTIPDFEGWHRAFTQWGRILRGPGGDVIGIREYKDASDSERAIREVNPGFYCFDARWLWSHIDRLGRANAQGEYYLTDLIHIAVHDGDAIATMPIPPEQAVGVNSPEELAIAEELARRSN